MYEVVELILISVENFPVLSFDWAPAVPNTITGAVESETIVTAVTGTEAKLRVDANRAGA